MTDPEGWADPNCIVTLGLGHTAFAFAGHEHDVLDGVAVRSVNLAGSYECEWLPEASIRRLPPLPLRVRQ